MPCLWYVEEAKFTWHGGGHWHGNTHQIVFFSTGNVLIQGRRTQICLDKIYDIVDRNLKNNVVCCRTKSLLNMIQCDENTYDDIVYMSPMHDHKYQNTQYDIVY